MPSQPLFPLYDRALGGRLPTLLRRWQDQQLPLSEIVFRLRIDHDIHVSASTVGRWLRELDQLEEEPASS